MQTFASTVETHSTGSKDKPDHDADTLIAAATWANQRGDVAATLRYLTTLRLVRPDDRAIGAEIERLRRAPIGR